MNAWLDLNKSQACHMDRRCARVLGSQQRLGCVRVFVFFVDSVGYRLCLCSCEQCMLNYVCVLVNSIGYVVFVLL